MAAKPLIAVLVSGNGSNLQAIIDATQSGEVQAEIVLVVSNNPDAFGLERAAIAGINTEVLLVESKARKAYDAQLAELVGAYDVDLVVLAGWNRLLSNVFLADNSVINVHPALPGAFVGLGAIDATFEKWSRGEVAGGGVMVHYVPDEGVDDGPVICSEAVAISTGDSLADFEANMHVVEHKLLVQAIQTVLSSPPKPSR